MPYKQSWLQIVRTPIKSIFFLVLLAVLTVFLTIGLSVFFSATKSVTSAHGAFSTIGIIEYKDPLTGDACHWRGNYDFSPILNSNHTESYDQRIALAGFSEQLIISDDVHSEKSGSDYSVIEFIPVKIIGGDSAECRIEKILYSGSTYFEEGMIIPIKINLDEEFSWDLGARYVTSLFGHAQVAPYRIEGHLQDLGLKQESFEPIMQIHHEDYLNHGNGLLWGHLIQKYKNSLHTATVYATNNLETMLIFHQKKALVVSGSHFSAQDYHEGHPVCIISTKLAKSSGLELGDKIFLSFSETSLPLRFLNSIFYVDSFNHLDIIEKGTFEIIGLYQVVENLGQGYGLSDDSIFVPQKSVSFWPNKYITMNNLVSFRLTNGTVEAFLEEMEQHDLPGLNFTFYDQGYSKVSATLANMRKTALLLIGICAVAGLGVIMLFSLLFVGRQRHSIAIMYSLGTSRGKALAFLLTTVLIIAGLAVSIGGITGHVLADKVLEDIYAWNSEEIALSAAFSEVYGDDNEMDFQIITPDKPVAPLTAAGTVLVVTFVLSGILTAKILRAEPMQVLTQKED